MNMKKTAMALIVAAGCAFNASALTITPSWDPQWNGENTGAGFVNPLNAAQAEVILGLTPGSLTEAYKSNVGGSDEKAFKDSYTTSYFNTPSDPSDATIVHNDGTPSIDPNQSIYLGLKDGNHSPWFYIFDLTGIWNGTETITLTGFWPQRGAISHITVFTGPSIPGEPPDRVPDLGATALLMGLSLLGLGGLRRRMTR